MKPNSEAEFLKYAEKDSDSVRISISVKTELDDHPRCRGPSVPSRTVFRSWSRARILWVLRGHRAGKEEVWGCYYLH